MPERFAKGILAACFLCVIFPCAAPAAFDGDGFSAARKLESKYFTIHLAPGVDAGELCMQLDMSFSSLLLAGENSGRADSGEMRLARMVDALYLRACAILDMNLYSFHGNIKVCRDTPQVRRAYDSLFDSDSGDKPAFYVNDLNTVYIAATNFKKEILGHEMGHALICHYFAVSPSIQIQEVLATYVEYQLRK